MGQHRTEDLSGDREPLCQELAAHLLLPVRARQQLQRGQLVRDRAAEVDAAAQRREPSDDLPGPPYPPDSEPAPEQRRQRAHDQQHLVRARRQTPLRDAGGERGPRRDAHGASTATIDVGLFSTADADVGAAEVAGAGHADLAALRAARDRGAAMEAMASGAASVALALHAEGRLDGVLAVGGSGGSSVASRAMRALPLGGAETAGLHDGLG
ncbi:Tm-1-like ATP-binding domain-containing protein [Streptomyces sp. MMS24-I2-30]|uniref:Tm-1-like ATP-binding domain-containing protein n=1 Tax=Streptomyces sp. MMS24-I2-30 TaxID=3351564 RepID=UPI003896D8B4